MSDFEVSDDELDRMIQRIVNSFDVWLRNHIGNDSNSKYFTGYEMRIRDDKYQVVFAFQKNGEDKWWMNLGEIE